VFISASTRRSHSVAPTNAKPHRPTRNAPPIRHIRPKLPTRSRCDLPISRTMRSSMMAPLA